MVLSSGYGSTPLYEFGPIMKLVIATNALSLTVLDLASGLVGGFRLCQVGG